MNYTEMCNYAREVNRELRANDPRFNHSVSLMMRDGSFFHMCGAFVEEKEDWVVLYSEHYGVQVFEREDVYRYSELVYPPAK